MSDPEYDPFAAFKTMRDSNLELWAKAMMEIANRPAYNQAMSAFLDSYLTTSIPLQRVVEQTMTQVLGNLNMPTRNDVTSIAERLTNIEMRLDDLEAKLDVAIKGAPAKAASPSAVPRRRKKSKES